MNNCQRKTSTGEVSPVLAVLLVRGP